VDADAIVKLASNLPFAVLVAVWFMWRLEPLMRALLFTNAQILEELRHLNGVNGATK